MAKCYIGAWRRDADMETWIEQEMAWIGDADDDGFLYAQPMASELSGGRIALTTQRIGVPDDRYPSRFHPLTGGLAPTEVVWMISDDGGRTWTSPRVPLFDGASRFDTNGTLLELNNGDWFWPCERWKAWEDASPTIIRGFGLLSRDCGETWEKIVNLPRPDESRICSHSKFARRQDGRFCGLGWTTSPGMLEDHDLCYIEADASCRSWLTPRSTGIPGQNSWILDRGNGVMAATVAVGENDAMEPGVYAFFSEDDGATWHHDDAVMLWAACDREREQFRRDSDSLFKVAFGQVAIATDVDGGILYAWRCFDEDEETCIRYARLDS